ncbi:MAG: hypothetical protein HIU93_15975 [Acidobacteria bacterium]|nr:hypothetical protein [Acidobacteriota bacterium]
MRPLKKPAYDPNTVFSLCVSGVKDLAENAKLTAIAPLICQAGIIYDKLASSKELHLLASEQTVGGDVTVAEMKDLYAASMSAKKGSARNIYDEIINSVQNKVCPLCGIGSVRSLDHHMPQSKFPEYVVNPVNLVPCCFDCNKAKFTKFPKTANQQTIHPYFDNYTQDVWLRAEVIQKTPPALRFYADGPQHWSLVDRERVKRHFDVFRLAELFTSNAGNELGSIRWHLVKTLHGDETAIRGHLQEIATSCRAEYLNSWRTATYEALSANEWFIKAGFQSISEPQ